VSEWSRKQKEFLKQQVQERDEKNRELTGKVNSLQRELSRKDKDIKNLRDRLSNPSQVQDVRRMLEDPLKGLHAENKKKSGSGSRTSTLFTYISLSRVIN